MLMKHTSFGWDRKVEETKAKGSKEIAVFSSYQEYCFQCSVPLFDRDVDILSPEKDDQSCEILEVIVSKKQLTRMWKKN